MSLLSILLLFINLVTLIIFYKYSIDKNSTIKELEIKKNKYKQHSWNLRTESNPLEDSFNKANDLINKFRLGQQILAQDIMDTENLNDPETKKDMVNAVLNLEFYAEISNDKNK